MTELRQPNILWICSDQQRWDTSGATGNRLVQTPNIDRLYAEGAAVRARIARPRSALLAGRAF